MTPDRIAEIEALRKTEPAHVFKKAWGELLTAARELVAAQNTIAELRAALEGMSELCGNYFDESQLVCDRDKQIWAMMLKALSAKGPDEQS